MTDASTSPPGDPARGPGAGESAPATHRTRRWSEHPLSVPANLSIALATLFFFVLLPIRNAPVAAWVVLGIWVLANVALVTVIARTRRLAVETRAAEDDAEGPVEGTSLLRDALRRLRRNQLATVSLGIILVLIALCFAQRLIYAAGRPEPGARETSPGFFALHVDHTRVNKDEAFQPPSSRHWFGTDGLGRDTFARTLYGGSISFVVGLVATLVSLAIGLTWGATAGYFGGRVDHYMMRVVDVLYGLPFIFLVILILTLINGLHATAAQHRQDVVRYRQLESEGRHDEAARLADERGIDRSVRTAVTLSDWANPVIVMFVALGLVQWLTLARITRGQVLSLKEREFVVAARVVGAGNARIIFRHIIPNLLGPVIVYTTLTIPTVILAEAFLSFIGLGIPEPDCSWGTLASEGIYAINVIKPYWWLITYPAAAISLALFSLNFIGDGLRDALDPRQRR